VIGFLWNLDTEARSPERDQMQRDGRATSTMTSTMTGKERYEARQ
jgi:hypothetical protein